MNKGVFLALIALAFGAGWGIAKYRTSIQPELAATAQTAIAQVNPLNGYVLTGQMTNTEGGKQYLAMTWTRRGDKRGWKWDQTYYDQSGRFVKATEQWCIHGGEAFMTSSDNPTVRKLGECSWPILGGQPRAAQSLYMGEPVRVHSSSNAQFASEQVIADRIGLPLKIIQRFSNGDTSIMETKAVEYKPLSDDVLKAPVAR